MIINHCNIRHSSNSLTAKTIILTMFLSDRFQNIFCIGRQVTDSKCRDEQITWALCILT